MNFAELIPQEVTLARIQELERHLACFFPVRSGQDQFFQPNVLSGIEDNLPCTALFCLVSWQQMV